MIGKWGFLFTWRLKLAYSKYRAVPTEIDGVRFASKKEAKRYQELRLLERAGHVRDLQLQPSWTFSVAGNAVLIRSEGFPNGRKLKYQADFQYFDVKAGKVTVEDVKGMRTDVYKIKRALMEACHGIIVREV